MLRKKQKGQSLTEFALILPLFLLLLLGVVEASRVVWSYITVQAAAREAARFAVTGRPNVTSGSPTKCEIPENEMNGEPWVCDPVDRAKAIKAVARERGRTIAVSQFCDDDWDQFTIDTPDVYDNECGDEPGAFGIAIVGQIVDTDAVTPTVKAEPDHAGSQGLNVAVSTYYNIEMIDPIFDALMGGNFIRVTGQVQMQNEGLDQSLGFPPEPLPDVPIDGGDIPPGSSGPVIISESGTEVEQNSDLKVRLDRHYASPYDIRLKNSVTDLEQIISADCTAVTTNANGQGTYDCRIDSTKFVEGEYYLYSTSTGVTTAEAIYGSSEVNFEEATVIKIVAGTTPRVEVAGGDVWAAGSRVNINLINHEGGAGETYDLYLQTDPTDLATASLIQSNLAADASPTWDVDYVGAACPQGSGTACRLLTMPAGVSPTANPYAVGDIFINNPEITLSQGQTTYERGALMRAFLQGHTPNHEYDVWIEGITSTIKAKLETVTTDSVGQYSVIEEFILPAWLDGEYELVSYEVGTQDPPIATEQITISTPNGPFITVDGGYTWPVGSFINIRVHQHTAAEHYLDFGPWRVPTSNAPDTFTVGANGTQVLGYTIPLSAATGTTDETYTVASYLNSNNNQEATRDVTVVPIPLIQVEEGDTVLPNSTITIKLSNHSPNSSYAVYYGKEISNPNGVGKSLFTIITDANGEATRTYNLAELPSTPPPNFSRPDTCGCYGKFYHMYSEALDGTRVAFTEMAIDSADLAITNIEVPPDAQINTTVPITFTIRNLKPVTISRYFDIDLYQNPSPLVPAYSQNQFNFPGDAKYWRNFVAPNGQPGDTFVITHTEFYVGQYGDQEFYGYADTTDLVVFEPDEENNINSEILSVVCTPDEVNSGFDWTEKLYGNDTEGSANTGNLDLTSDGKSSAGNDDDADNRGHLLLHLDEPITTTAGFEVITRVDQAPETDNYSKGGIQIRNAVDDPRSMKIEFNLAWHENKKEHRVQVSLRNDTGAAATTWKSNRRVDLDDGPVWLRIVRQPNSNTYNFYYRQRTAEPTNWGQPYSTAGVAMDEAVYVGLFNASYEDDVEATSRFSNFSYTDSSACVEAQGQPTEEIPPGLTICTDLLKETSFETPNSQSWRLGTGEGVFYGPSILLAHTGLYRLVAPSFDSNYNTPFFYQQFTMPSWVISSTTGFNLTLYRDIDDLGTDDGDDDQFYAVVSTSPNPATAVTTPTLIAEGSSTTDWEFSNKGLALNAGVNLEDYAGQQLYAYFYNNSNGNCNFSTLEGCYATNYSFDDVQLTSCTTQPPPANVESLLRGRVTLHRSGGSSEQLAGVKVWAYTEDGELHETFTAQDGSYAFYNLAPGTYYIYSEYHFIDATDPSQIETLATNTTAQLSFGPALVVDLDLYAISP